jgi:hypothetical protein
MNSARPDGSGYLRTAPTISTGAVGIHAARGPSEVTHGRRCSEVVEELKKLCRGYGGRHVARWSRRKVASEPTTLRGGHRRASTSSAVQIARSTCSLAYQPDRARNPTLNLWLAASPQVSAHGRHPWQLLL